MGEVVLVNGDEYLKYLESIKPKKKKSKPKSTKKSTGKKEDKKKDDKKKDLEEAPGPKKEDPKAPQPKGKGLFSNLGGRILGRKVQGPEAGGKKGRSTARSGI